MKRILIISALAALVAASCSKGFTKKHEARFKVNGTQYNCGEDAVSASYYNSDVNYLQVTCAGGNSQTFNSIVTVHLTDLNQTVNIDSADERFAYINTGSTYYKPKSGTWEITSHKEGNPATRHTEGKFDMVVYNSYNPADTFHITDGYFYVNNY